MKIQRLRQRLRASVETAILDAAEAVAGADGLPGASLHAIALRAGVAVGTIYNYFEDRQQLLDEVFTRRRGELSDIIEGAARSHDAAPFEQQLDAFLSAVFGYFEEHRLFLRIALEAAETKYPILKGEDAKSRPAMQQLEAHAERIVGLGIQEGRVRAEAPQLYATVLASIVRGVLIARLHADGTLVDAPEIVAGLFLKGAAP
jgi:AcrR family transcriptional regulator